MQTGLELRAAAARRHPLAVLAGELLARDPSIEVRFLDALAELGWPAYTRELASFITARAGRAVTVSSLNALAEAERRAYQRGRRRRAVWLCCGLTHDRYESIARLWARDDWLLHRRIVAPTTGRVQYLTITARLCDLALHAEAAADPARLRMLAAEHARDIPGIRVGQGAFELERWRDVALALLAELGPLDELARLEAAERLHKYPESYQLFGMPEALAGMESVGGQR